MPPLQTNQSPTQGGTIMTDLSSTESMIFYNKPNASTRVLATTFTLLSAVLDALNEMFGSSPLIQTADDVQKNIRRQLEENVSDIVADNPAVEDELDEIKRELERLAVPPGVSQGLAVLRLIYRINKLVFVLIDPR